MKSGNVPVHEYWDFLDGVRGVAVLFVLLFHFKVPGWTAGYLGVDMFFVISGFLVTRTNIHPALTGTFSLPHFYFRRIRRLFPELFLLLGATTAVALFLASPQGLLEVAQSGLAQALFVANYFFWSKVSYFDTSASAKPLLHCWSLSVEEQFYFIYALFLRHLYRLRSILRHSLLLALTLLSLVAFLLVGRVDHSAAFYSLPTRLWEPLVGCIAGFALHSQHSILSHAPFRTLRPLISLLGMLCTAGTLVYHDDIVDWGGREAVVLIPVFSTASFIFVNAQGKTPTLTGHLLRVPPLRWVGQISYSLYLWHWPMICFFRCFYSFTTPSVPMTSLVTAVILASLASDLLVGRRFRRLGVAQFPRWSILVPFLYLSLSTALIAIHPFPQRASWLSDTFHIKQLSIKHAAMHDKGSTIGFTYDSFCNVSIDGYNPKRKIPGSIVGSCGNCKKSSNKKIKTVLVLGDSHAFTLVQATKNISLRNDHTCLLFMTGSGCLPFANVKLGKGSPCSEPSCTQLAKEVGKFLFSHKSGIDLILLVGRWKYYTGKCEVLLSPQQISSLGLYKVSSEERRRQSFKFMYESMLKLVHPIPVGVMTQIPSYWEYSGSNALCWTYLSCEGTNFTRPYSMYRDRFTHQFLLESARKGQVHLLDTLDILCDGQSCSPFYRGRMIYHNVVHVNYEGATLFYPMLEKLFHKILD